MTGTGAGGHDAAVSWLRRGARTDDPAATAPPGTVDSVVDAVRAAGTGAVPALDHLVEVLAAADAAGGQDSALGVLAARPRVLRWLDRHARRFGQPPAQADAYDRMARRTADGTAGPCGIALAASHPDGHVRERAVAAIAARPSPELAALLVLRSADWVAPVRDRARAALALLLAEEPERYLPVLAPTIGSLAPRLRGGFAHAQATAALLASARLTRGFLGPGTDPRLRRLACTVALGQHWLSLDELVARAESEPDARIRSWATEAACRELVWTGREATLRRLARARHAQVRALALTGLSRLGADRPVADRLDDDAPLVRALARAAARRLGVDVVGHYRAALSVPVPAVGAIAGLAEAGEPRDVPLIRRLLVHPAGPVRAAAVRALRQAAAVEVDHLLDLLWDASPGVVREVALALAGHDRVPAELGWRLLRADRPELRRAGYRLLRDRSVGVRVRAMLILVGDADPELARRGRADLTGFSRRLWAAPAPRLPAAERAESVELIRRVAPRLGADVTSALLGWLSAGTSPDR